MPEAGNAGVRCPQAAPGSAGCRVRRKLGGGAMEMSALPNIVLVHGAWAHGSSWSAVIERLQADGYQVTAPQFPLTSLADDVARLRQVLARQNGPTVVAGHSYGGQIITALGTDAPNVVGLVYIAAFGLDEGESIGALLGQAPPPPALAHLDVDQQSFAWLPEDDFVNHFVADVDPVKARVMFAVQQPLHWSALGEVMGVPAWKSLPSWFPVADGDPGDPARCPAAVRPSHGHHHRGGLDQPRGHGLPPRRSSSMYPTRPRSRTRRCSISSRPRPATSSRPRRQLVWAITLRCPSSARNACRRAVTSERSWRRRS